MILAQLTLYLDTRFFSNAIGLVVQLGRSSGILPNMVSNLGAHTFSWIFQDFRSDDCLMGLSTGGS
jgi:hypothetical protein